MRLAIIGSGALGSLFAAVLSPRSDLTMLGHWPQQLARLRSSGLTMIHPAGSRSTHHFKITDDPKTVPPVDLALVLVKSYQTERAALEIKQLLLDYGLAVTLQNGLGNIDILARVLGQHRVTQGITALGATMVEPGVVRFAGHGPTHLAQTAYDRNESIAPTASIAPNALHELARMMTASGLEAHIESNLLSLAWGKLVINCGINPLTALLRVPNGFLASSDQARALMIAAAEETASVAEALNITLPYPNPAKRVLEVAQATAGNQSSMLQDVLRGSQTEIDAICGVVVSHGRTTGVPTPINAEFLRLIRMLSINKDGEPIVGNLETLQTLLSASEID